MPNDQISKINFNAPKEKKLKVENIEKELENIRKKYSDIINPSIKKKIVGKIIPHKKKEYEASKAQLKEKLQKHKKELKTLERNYDRDKEFCKDIKRLIQYIDVDCYKAGIKKIDIKLTREELLSFADEVENSLKIINHFLNYLEKKMRKIEKLKSRLNGNSSLLQADEKKKGELKNLISDATKYKINTLEENRLLKYKPIKNKQVSVKECEDKQTNFKKLKEIYDSIVKNLQSENCDFMKEKNKLKKLIPGLNNFTNKVSQFTKGLNSILEGPSNTSLDEKIETAIKELKKKIEFAKELEEYKVFDANMGVWVKGALKSLQEMQKLAKEYGDNILCESQPCLEIAMEEKEMKKQYDHSKDRTNIGPCYIVVNKSSQKVREAYSYTGTVLNGSKTTINASSKQPEAENEVKNYLMHALQNGEFKNDDSWREPYKKDK